MNEFAEWLSGTAPSALIQRHEAWSIPLLQSLHIIGIGIVVGSTVGLVLRVLGWIGTDRTLGQTLGRFGPWLAGALLSMLLTGGLLVVAEPVRELVTFSFWLKMTLVAALAGLAVAFGRSVKRDERAWEPARTRGPALRLAALLTFLLLACIILLGRLIAYDHIWGHLSPATKA